jgi:hypothetical protein
MLMLMDISYFMSDISVFKYIEEKLKYLKKKLYTYLGHCFWNS